ncbi:hypothetical protein OIU85_000811 [Salix viminalis]|uniref:Uncharacterized protein n=1 Tax=Salix viminalis TaxID=40686 RepID=A0A9Q0VJX1_SALVM|nr:hypothetical protein OIU85_000811 [Salix viminalis]
MYRGILPEYYKVVPSVGIVFMTYETLKMLLSLIPATETPTHVGSSDDKPFPAEVSRTIIELSSAGTLSTLTPYG